MKVEIKNENSRDENKDHKLEGWQKILGITGRELETEGRKMEESLRRKIGRWKSV
jgi:hypothetical protein